MAKFSLIVIELLLLITIFELDKAQSASLEKFKKNNEKVAGKIKHPIERYRIL